MISAALKQRQALGQFLTPPAIANFMASLFEHHPHEVKLLDPGAGTGALSGCTRSAIVSSHCTAARNSRDSLRSRFPLDPSLQENVILHAVKPERVTVSASPDVHLYGNFQDLKRGVRSKQILHVG
jgi:hypothetical protein